MGGSPVRSSHNFDTCLETLLLDITLLVHKKMTCGKSNEKEHWVLFQVGYSGIHVTGGSDGA